MEEGGKGKWNIRDKMRGRPANAQFHNVKARESCCASDREMSIDLLLQPTLTTITTPFNPSSRPEMFFPLTDNNLLTRNGLRTGEIERDSLRSKSNPTEAKRLILRPTINKKKKY